MSGDLTWMAEQALDLGDPVRAFLIIAVRDGRTLYPAGQPELVTGDLKMILRWHENGYKLIMGNKPRLA
jgi:hypothetical protein